MRIISRRTDGNGFGCSTIKVAQVVCDFFELICSKLFAVIHLVQNDRIVSWLCLVWVLAT